MAAAGTAVLVAGYPASVGTFTVVAGTIASVRGTELYLAPDTDEGFSGGPVVLNGRVAGIVFGHGGFGRAVPSGIIDLYLQGFDVRWGSTRSEPTKLAVPKLSAPRLIFPQQGAKLSFSDRLFVTFSWEPVPGAVEYRLEIQMQRITRPYRKGDIGRAGLAKSPGPAYRWDL